jgi:hypothetical protein
MGSANIDEQLHNMSFRMRLGRVTPNEHAARRDRAKARN